MNQITIIAFDLFGVIFTEGHLISKVLMQLLPTRCDKAQVKTLYEAFGIGAIHENEFWEGLAIDDTDGIRRDFLDSFRLDEDYHAVIKALLPQYRLAILSNLPPDWADALVEKFRFSETFKPCYFSGFAGCKKPQAEIYQQFLSQAGVAARQVAFIDDRLENLDTAHKLGMQTIYYQKDMKQHDFEPDHTIHRLKELLPLLTQYHRKVTVQ